MTVNIEWDSHPASIDWPMTGKGLLQAHKETKIVNKEHGVK